MENVINCDERMVKIAQATKNNFKPLSWQKNATLTGVGFDCKGNKVIEFVEYQDEYGFIQQTYNGNLTAYDNRVVNF